MLDGDDADLSLDRLRRLPFVDSDPDGLLLHDTIREAVAASLKASDPETHRRYRVAAWARAASGAVRGPPRRPLARDRRRAVHARAAAPARVLLPDRRRTHLLEPARAADGPAITAIARRHEPREAARLIETWARGTSGRVMFASWLGRTGMRNRARPVCLSALAARPVTERLRAGFGRGCKNFGCAASAHLTRATEGSCSMATRSSSSTSSTGTFVCPECGREFGRASALGAHRKRSHGVAGTSRSATPSSGGRRARRTGQAAVGGATAVRAASGAASGAAATTAATGATARRRSSSRVDSTRGRAGAQAGTGPSSAATRDALLRVLFPQGVPARASVIAALEPWLAEADRLARVR
jgi:hypothetical protein